MTWREEAKELGVPLYDHALKRVRKKADVEKDTMAARLKVVKPESECKDIKIVVRPEVATEICRRALFDYVSLLGMTNVTCEKWFINCKRKGIVFKGQKNDDDKLVETEIDSGQESRTGEHVSEGGKG